MRILTTADGRVRLAWRLFGFFGITLAVVVLLGALLPGGVVVGSAVLLVGSLVAGWVLLSIDGRGPRALGFPLSRGSATEAALGLGMGTALGLSVVLGMAVLGGLHWTADGDGVAGWPMGALAALLYLSVPAAAEEALLRGYPLQALGEVWGPNAAVIVTAIAFGLLHLGNPGAGVLETTNVAVAGLLLGVVYVRTLSLWWATGVHLGWNWAHGYLADVPVSGLEVLDAPGYDGVTAGPDWLGGGGFGPEGSVVATVVVLAATAALWLGPWLKPTRTTLATGALLAERVDSSEEGTS